MTISVWYHTFGCKANQYDTERMRQELESRGAATCDAPAAASAAVLNTCTVTDQADLSARRLIRKLARRHPDLRIVVAGCSSALQADTYRAMREVDGVVAGQDPVAVAAEVAPESALAAEDQEPIGGALLRSSRRGSRGWLKIQDGCDRKCSFCATQLARGVSRSRPADQLIAEGRLLSRRHAELVLTGIHIGHYGRDLEPADTLSELCGRLLREVPEVRFRLGSIEATEIDDSLVDLIADSGGFLAPHLHVPLQSGSDAVLRRMRRWHTREQYRRRVLEIAERIQPLGLGADIIVGFPGETDADHVRTRELVEALPYTYLHVFPYLRPTGNQRGRSSRQGPFQRRVCAFAGTSRDRCCQGGRVRLRAFRRTGPGRGGKRWRGAHRGLPARAREWLRRTRKPGPGHSFGASTGLAGSDPRHGPQGAAGAGRLDRVTGRHPLRLPVSRDLQ